MPFASPRRARALDGDPTLAASSSFSPSSPANRHNLVDLNSSVTRRAQVATRRWPSSPSRNRKTWENDDQSSETPCIATKLAPFLIPSDQDEISSIDRPINASRLDIRGLSMTSLSPDEPADLPTLSLHSKHEETSTTTSELEKTPKQKHEKQSPAAVTPPSSPFRYKKSNSQARRELAKKILQQRKKSAPGVTKTDKEKDKRASAPSNKGFPSYQGDAAACCVLGGAVKAITSSENEIHTKAPGSADETVSWASTLTTDPSRLVTSNFKLRASDDEKSGQVPYLRMEALPSVAETEEPPQGRLDRHLLHQQRSITSPSLSRQRGLHQPRLHESTQPMTPLSMESATAPQQQQQRQQQHDPPQVEQEESFANSIVAFETDQRDDQIPPGRRMLNESQSEVNESYLRSSPDRTSAATRSDPGTSSPWPYSSDGRPSPLINYGSNDDTLVTLLPGGETFEHSSHILAYASPVLRQKLQPVLGGWYRLDLHQTSTVEWQLLQPFLEPHSVQSAVVTPSNLSHLLPWFVQLQLDILLAESDQILVTLEFPKAYSSEGTAAALAADNKSPPPASIPQVKDMVDILLLTEISSLAHLHGTCAASLETLESYLALHPGLAANNDALTILVRILQDHPSVRQRLWRRSLVRFLPSDLPIFNSKEERTNDSELVIVETMVYNPLFFFLLREGLRKASKEDDHNRRTMELEERWKRFRQRQQKVSQTPSVWKSAMRENSIIEDSRTCVDESFGDSTVGSLSLSRSDRDSVNTSNLQGNAYLSSESAALNMISMICDDGTSEDFAEWWMKWSGEAHKIRDVPKPKTSLQKSLAGIRSRAESQKLKEELEEIAKSERSRTNWLELILLRLNRPPIFPTEGDEGLDEPGIPLPQAAQKDKRKFLC